MLDKQEMLKFINNLNYFHEELFYGLNDEEKSCKTYNFGAMGVLKRIKDTIESDILDANIC